MMQVPTIGRVILVRMDQKENNGADVAPAIITRVWSECADSSWTINAKILADHEMNIWRTSLSLFSDQATADRERPNGVHVGWWPPRD